MKKVVKKIRITNALGLHTRPATTIVKFLQDYQCEVFFTYNKERVDAKRVLNLIMLAAGKNAQVTITCEGEDAEEAMAGLVAIFENRFGE